MALKEIQYLMMVFFIL